MERVWTKGELKSFFVTVSKDETLQARVDVREAVTNALAFMFARQTQDEQAQHSTSHSNGIGFTGADAAFCSSVASRNAKYASICTPKQTKHVAKKLAKYSGQIILMQQTDINV